MSMYVFRRVFKGQRAIVAINTGAKKHRVDVPLTNEEQKLSWKQVWPPVVKSVRPSEKTIHASLPAKSVKVYIGGKR
jgi:O-glycosyl hydrolase